jgi:hypothetical protein
VPEQFFLKNGEKVASIMPYASLPKSASYCQYFISKKIVDMRRKTSFAAAKTF